jgi:nucleotide-binding universal stress UspA family protein
VHLVHVLELYTLARKAGMAPPTLALSNQAAAAALDYLQEVAARWNLGEQVTCEVLQEPVIETLLAYVQRIDADLLVMTPRTTDPGHRLWMGSTAHLLSRISPCPILLVNPTEHDAGVPDFRNVLVPLDGSEAAELAIPIAYDLARLTDARVTLMTVTDPQGAPVPAAPLALAAGCSWSVVDGQNVRQSVGEYLDSVAERVLFAGLEACTATVVTRGSAAHQIIAYGATHNADVIVMTTHGEAGNRATLGRVVDQVARTARVPVLLCPV